MTYHLSTSQRDMLIEHMDGQGVPPLHRGSGNRYRIMCSLLARSMIKVDHRCKPPLMRITDTGREALAEALANWADALERVGFEIDDKLADLNADFAMVWHNRAGTQAEHPAEESFPKPTIPLDSDRDWITFGARGK